MFEMLTVNSSNTEYPLIDTDGWLNATTSNLDGRWNCKRRKFGIGELEESDKNIHTFFGGKWRLKDGSTVQDGKI